MRSYDTSNRHSQFLIEACYHNTSSMANSTAHSLDHSAFKIGSQEMLIIFHGSQPAVPELQAAKIAERQSEGPAAIALRNLKKQVSNVFISSIF